MEWDGIVLLILILTVTNEDWNDDARDEVDDVEFRMMGVSCSNGDRDPDGETLLQIAASPSSSSSSPSSSFSSSLPACALACQTRHRLP